MERLLNPGGVLSHADVLARFKASMLRDLGRSEPYLHAGQSAAFEHVILFYQRVGQLAEEGRMRNAPPEYFAIRLGSHDVAPLAAFFMALHEDFTHEAVVRNAKDPATSAAALGVGLHLCGDRVESYVRATVTSSNATNCAGLLPPF